MNIKRLNTPVAENMKRIIDESGLKQLTVAKRIGCTAQELTDMIWGRRIIKVSDIPKISMALGVGIEVLFLPVRDKQEAV